MEATSSFASPPPTSLPERRVDGWFVFLFFSNNLGCAGSLLVSAVVTLILLLLFGVIEIG
jgi:hypothetical protein